MKGLVPEIENVLLFELKGVSVRKIPHNFTVRHKGRNSYHETFEAALNKASSVLLIKKVNKEKRLNLDILIQMVRKHNLFFEKEVRTRLDELEMNAL